MRPLYGCVLAGGESRRMGVPKAQLEVGGKSFLEHTAELLGAVTSRVFISAGSKAGANVFQRSRSHETQGPSALKTPAAAARLPVLYDVVPDGGPLAGIATALESRRDAAWLVVAVDMPLLTVESLEHLVGVWRGPVGRPEAGHGAPESVMELRAQVTAFRSPRAGGPEPLCSLWEPDALPIVLGCMNGGERSVARCLGKLSVQLVDPVDERTLWNANTPADLETLRYTLEPRRSA